VIALHMDALELARQFHRSLVVQCDEALDLDETDRAHQLEDAAALLAKAEACLSGKLERTEPMRAPWVEGLRARS